MRKKINIVWGPNWIEAWIKPNPKKLLLEYKERLGKSIIIESYLNKDTQQVCITAWFGDKGKETTICVDSFEYNKKFIYLFSFDPDTEKAKCKRLLTREEGLKILSSTPHKLGKWDPLILNYDLQCGICGEWASNPCDGRVLEFVEKPDNESAILYKGKWYVKLSWRDWYIKTFYNRKEFEEMSNFYKEHGGIDERLKDWEDFDKTWEKYFNDKDNKENITAHNMPASGWRDISDRIYYFDRNPVIGAYEKVLTMGCYNTPNPDTIACPACDIIHRIYSETNVYRKWDYNIRIWWEFNNPKMFFRRLHNKQRRRKNARKNKA